MAVCGGLGGSEGVHSLNGGPGGGPDYDPGVWEVDAFPGDGFFIGAQHNVWQRSCSVLAMTDRLELATGSLKHSVLAAGFVWSAVLVIGVLLLLGAKRHEAFWRRIFRRERGGRNYRFLPYYLGPVLLIVFGALGIVGVITGRQYACTAVREVSSSPVIPWSALTRSPYGYVAGNPLNGTDPTGLDDITTLPPWYSGPATLCLAGTDTYHIMTNPLVFIRPGAVRLDTTARALA